jgi:hypothetical protein
METKAMKPTTASTSTLLAARKRYRDTGGCKFAWRATCSWVDGTYGRSAVHGYSGLGAEHRHKTAFSFDGPSRDCSRPGRGATPVNMYSWVLLDA